MQIVTNFYTKLLSDGSKEAHGDRNVTKAQAMHAAQTALIQGKQYTHPYYWSGFILIANSLVLVLFEPIEPLGLEGFAGGL